MVSPNILLGGGVALFRSTDGGESFGTNYIAAGFNIREEPHVDMQFAVEDPGYDGATNRHVYITSDGGIFRAEDISTATATSSPEGGWSQLNKTYQTTQFYTLAVDGSSGIIFGGTQDNGSLRINSGTTTDAQALVGGDGGKTAVDGNVCFGQETDVGGQLFRISNCASPSPTVAVIGAGITDYGSGVGLTPIIIDRNSTDHEGAFLGLRSVWRTASGVKTGTPGWYSIKANPAVTPDGAPAAYRPYVSALATAPLNSNYVWSGQWFPDYTDNTGGDLYRTTNALSIPLSIMWSKVDDGDTPLPQRQITAILVDPSPTPSSPPDSIVYVAFGGFEDDNLWRTTDAGAHWTDITGGSSEAPCNPDYELVGLPCAPIRAIARQPNDPATLYVGTEIGLYVTHDTGAHWRPVLQGPTNVSIVDLAFMDSDTLVVGTYGRGVWSGKPMPLPTAGDGRPNDFDGDGSTDLAVARPTGSPGSLEWHAKMTTDGYDSFFVGNVGDEFAPADYDGDGKTDMAVFQPLSQQFQILKSTDSTTDFVSLGDVGDIPVPADFDGDGVDDPAVFRPSNATWYVEQSTNGYMSAEWGAEEDTPVAADFDGDGRADLGAFELKNGGYWELSYVSVHGTDEIQFGLEGDIPVAGDYDGDGHADIAVWRPDYDENGNACWYVLSSISDYEEFETVPWGVSTDMPVPGDYDGDGRMDIGVWRPDNGMWHIRASSNGYYSALFGADGDIPIGRKVQYNARPTGRGTLPSPPGARPQRVVPQDSIQNGARTVAQVK